MTYTKQCLFIPLLFVVSSAQAELPPELPSPLNNLTIYSAAAITMGAGSIVRGNIQVNAGVGIGADSTVTGHIIAGAAVTLGATVKIGSFVEARDAGTIGANSTVAGHFTTGEALTLGATSIANSKNIMVDGDVTAGGAIEGGTYARINGDVSSVAAVTLGANTSIEGDVTAGAALTIGADVLIEGNTQAGSGAISLGAGAKVTDDARAGTSVTGGTVGGTITEGSPEQFTRTPKDPIDDQSPQVADIQADLTAMPAMPAPAANQLPTSMTASTTFTKGVYHTTALTTTAGITMTFDGEDEDGHWLINSDEFIAFGANTVIKLVNVTPDSTITWNAGGYISAGADVDLVGSFFAGSYIITGVSTTLKGVSDSCGGFFTKTGAVTLGATNSIGTIGCTATPADIPVIHHYEITHDGQGLTCAPEEVTIKACADANCETFYMDAIDVDLLIYNQTDNIAQTIPITVNGTTAVMKDTNNAVNFSYTSPGPVRLAIENQDDECKNGNSDSCDVEFTNAAFRFLYGDGEPKITDIGNQTAGSIFKKTLKLQAVIDDEGVCTGLFKDDISVNLWQENVTPKVTSGLSFSIEGNDIAKEQGEALTALIFDDNSIATIEDPRYHDAGEIRLHANYNVDGITLSGSSNLFWVSPAELVVSATSETSSLDGATAADPTTHVAGESFTLTVSAFNSLGDITQNYTPGNMQPELDRTGPTLEDSVDGRLTYASDASLATATGTSTVFKNVTLNDFSLGQSVYADAQYSEVGLLNLALKDSNYGVPGIVIEATAIDIGRFIPHHFTQTVAKNGAFMADCNTETATPFAYSGQKDVNNKGAISYVTNPILAITARNKQGAITENYYEDLQDSENDYMKLSAENISITASTLDEGNKLPLTANMNKGILSQNDLTALPDALPDALPSGVLHYQFSDSDNFFYNRDANTQVAPFSSKINFSTASITDADGVTLATETTADASPEGVQIRFGRLVLQNSFGPETSDLPQPMQIEYFTDDGFIVSSDNNCVSYDSTNIILDTTLTTRALPEEPAATTGNFLAGKTRTIKLAAPGAGNQGKIGVSYNASDWLRYDWNPDVEIDGVVYNENPSATATFGLFRGNDRIIYQREVFD
jgi:serine acetyltransferase